MALNMKTHDDLLMKLCSIRATWTKQDFIDAYEDEWDFVPEDLDQCHQMMEEYIYHTYDINYIKEVIDNETEGM